MTENPYKMTHVTTQETGLKIQLLQQFIADNEGDVFCGKTTLSLDKFNNPLEQTILKIKGFLTEGRAAMPYGPRDIMIHGFYEGQPVFIHIIFSIFDEVNQFAIEVTSIGSAQRIVDRINKEFFSECLPNISWWFMGRHGPDTKDCYLPSIPPIIRPEYYPDLDDPENYLKRYMNSDESVLMLSGPPGTGKTTLLRYLLIQFKLNAHVIFDENLMTNDAPFQSFLFDQSDMPAPPDADPSMGSNVMIIEDADTILTSRERDGNKLMSRFLNISDGLIKLPKKKLIFTTNILNSENMDEAILRPGRCFGVLHTRTLNLTEAQAVAKVSNLPIPIERREYTLAEIFNQHRNVSSTQSFGFGVRH